MSYLGLSSAIVGEVGKTVGGWVKDPFNRLFFYWYFFPVLLFILFHQFVIRPIAFNHYPTNPIDYANASFAARSEAADSETLSPGATATPEPAQATPQAEFSLPSSEASSGDYFVGLLLSFLGVSLFNYVLIPFVAAVGLNAIAFHITLFYTGRVPPFSWLLAPLKVRNAARSKALHGNLPEMRQQYLRLYRAMHKAAPDEAAHAGDVGQQVKDLKRKIQERHDEIEKKGRAQSLPTTAAWVTATALGNTLAVAEEYPFNTYGMDADLFWPRLRAELEAERLAPIDTAKSMMDGTLNLSLLAYLAAVESLVVIFLIPAGLRAEGWRIALLIGCGLLALFVGYGAYRAAVSAAHNMGMLMHTYFDYDRDRVLEKFGLKRPVKIEDEKIVWYRLAAFLRRGESFYFPEAAEADE